MLKNKHLCTWYTVLETFMSNRLSKGALSKQKGSESKVTILIHLWRSQYLKYGFISVISLDPALLSAAFSKKSGGTLFLVFRGARCVVRGAWFRIFSRYFVPLTPPTVFVRSFWNFTGVLRMVWRCTCGFLESWTYFLSLFTHFELRHFFSSNITEVYRE